MRYNQWIKIGCHWVQQSFKSVLFRIISCCNEDKLNPIIYSFGHYEWSKVYQNGNQDSCLFKEQKSAFWDSLCKHDQILFCLFW